MAVYALGESQPVLPEDGRYWIADNAMVIGDVVLHENASIWYGCVVRGDTDRIEIGPDSNIQDLAVLHTDHGIKLRIGRGVTVGHKVMLHGCEVGDNSLIGIGAIVLNNAKIGKNCIIGAGALIPEGKEIPDNSLVVGAPGRVICTLDDATAELLKASAAHYVENSRRHKSEMKRIDA